MTAPSPDSNAGTGADPDAALVQRAQAGDADAFGSLMRAHHDVVFRRVLNMVRNEHDARDLCQEIWVAVWRELSRFRGESRFSTWLYALSTRRSIDHLRKRRRWFDRFLPFTRKDPGEDREVTFEPAETAPGPDRQLELQEKTDRFEKALASLPPALRAVYTLKEIEGLSYAEIAHTLNCPIGTVMSRLHSARRQLARHVASESTSRE